MKVDINKAFILAAYHPVTTEYDNYKKAEIFINSLDEINLPVIIMWPNADGGSNEIAKCYRKYREK